MKVSYEWLKDIVAIDMSAEQVAEKLMLAGHETESITKTGIGAQPVVVVEIKEIEKHPDADRLSVTKVDAGEHGVKQIVTNLKGLSVGTKLFCALEGAVLPGDFKIKRSKLKGVESEGMFVGWEELGFDYKCEDPVFVEQSALNGTNYTELAAFNDTVIELELTANRGDCLGIYGVAREVRAFSGAEIKVLPMDCERIAEQAADIFKVDIQTPNCHRYTGGVIKNVKIGPSPLWMQLRLIQAGIRPISNVVDITNYVLIETNQPLHAFDMDKIADRSLIVRDAGDGEMMTTLDDTERKLESNDILIADKEQGHCLGGVMGGQVSEVTGSTQNIFLEAAFFNGPNIRKTSRRLNLRSDSSYRFERTTDKENVLKALKRALVLFSELGVGEVCTGEIDIYPGKYEEKKLSFSADWINGKLGSEIEEEQIISILEALGFAPQKNGAEIEVFVPAWRSDVGYREDLAEEVGRVYGYNNIKPTLYPSYQAAMRDERQSRERTLLELMYQTGCDEVMNFSFVGKALFDKMELPGEHPFRDIIYLGVPLTDDWAGMRSSLIPGMVKTTAYNVTRQNKSLSLFELGNVSLNTGEEMPLEEKRLALALAGRKYDKDHTADEVKYDFYDIKGILDTIAECFKVEFGYSYSDENYLQPYQQADILLKGKKIGVVGKLHPAIADSFDIDVDCFVAELNVNRLFEAADETIVYREVPKFPSSERDLALVISEKVTAEELFRAVQELKLELLQDIRLFDIYKGKGIAEGEYSVAIKLSFNKVTSTLTDKEVEAAIQQILKALEERCGARLR